MKERLKKKFTKLLAAVMAVVLVAGMFPLTAQADTVGDNPPDVSDPALSVSNLTKASLTLGWNPAAAHSGSGTITYDVYRVSADTSVIDSLANIQNNNVTPAFTDLTDNCASFTGLTAGTVYSFNVVAKDEAGNKTCYTAQQFTTVDASGFAGAGVAGDPYIITTLDQLEAVSNYPSAYFELGNDITEPLEMPLCNDVSPFTGSFDGKGYSITVNLPHTVMAYDGVNSDSYYYVYDGVFSYIGSGATVSNLTVEGSVPMYMGGLPIYKNKLFAGALAGYNAGMVTDCTSNVSVSSAGGDSSDINYIGGLVGYNAGTVTGCKSTGSVSSTNSGADYIGGLIGYNNTGTVTGGSASGNVDAAGVAYAGGLVGYTQGGGPISDSRATGSVSVHNIASQTSYGGGLVGYVGYMTSDTLLQCDYASGDIYAANIAGSGHESDFGGLVGYMYGTTIDRCFAAGDIIASNVTVTDAVQAFGGLVGYIDNGTIKYSYATGDFVGTSVSSACYAGGLAGYNAAYYSRLAYSYAGGGMTETNGTNTHLGGFLGSYYNSLVCTSCYWNNTKNSISVGDPGKTAYGTGLPPEQMTGTAAAAMVSGLNMDGARPAIYYETKANDASYWHYPQLLAFSDSGDAPVRDASLASVRLSTACDVTSWTSPSGPSVRGTNVAITVADGVTSITIDVTASDGASWKLYSDSACTSELTDKTIALSDGCGTAYLLVTAENAAAAKQYTLTVRDSSYTISPIADQTLTALAAGYASGTQESREITITKTGTRDLENLAVSLGGANASSFTVTQPGATTLDGATASTTFTVKANDGLAVGIYTATVTISADNMTDVTFTVTQSVRGISVWDGSVSAILSGSGTSADPYQINTAADLAYLAYYSGTAGGKYYSLNTDIDLAGHQWPLIGGIYTTYFSGTFLGNGHTIYNLTIDSSGESAIYQFAGLFGLTVDATISDLTLSDAYIHSQSVRIGALIAWADSGTTMTNCHVINSDIKGVGSSSSYVGGLIGTISSTRSTTGINVTGCSSSATVSILDNPANKIALGGLVGALISTYGVNEVDIVNSYSDGEVIGPGVSYGFSGGAGGLVGSIFHAVSSGSNIVTMSNCYSSCPVSGQILGIAGGFLGNAELTSGDSVTITGCYATGDVSASGALSDDDCHGVGGFVGHSMRLDITNCYAVGDVAQGGTMLGSVGGFVGKSLESSFLNCSAWGDVSCAYASGDDGVYVGGFAGKADASSLIENCFARGTVTGAASIPTGRYNYPGGFIGKADGTVTNCYASGQVIGNSAVSKGFAASVSGVDITYSYYNSTLNTASDSSATGVTTAFMRADYGAGGALVDLLNEPAAAHSSDGWETWTVKNGSYPVLGVAADQDAPTGLGIAAPTGESSSDGRITNTTTAMEYKLSTESEWIAVTGSAVTGLSSGAYDVRYAEKAGYYPGAAAQIIVGVCVVSEWISPEAPEVHGTDVSKTVRTDHITIDVTVTGTSWALYSDEECNSEIADKQMNLNIGANTAYLKVADGSDSRIYTLIITRASSACDVVTWISPANPVISDTTVTKTVDSGTSSLLVDVDVSAGASWALYSDAECANEIVNKIMPLAFGSNSAYLKVIGGIDSKIYTIQITRADSIACDVITWRSPADPAISGTTVTKEVDSGTASLTLDMDVSAGASWALYSDAGCTVGMAADMTLAPGNNIAYLKVTAQDGIHTKIYTININKRMGTGVSGDPYIITTLAELKAVTDRPSSYYQLGSDITDPLDTPLCSETSPFTGSFDGAGHSVVIGITSPGGHGGLFSDISAGASVSALTVTGSISNNAHGTVYMGGLAGYSAGTVTNCTSGAIVTDTSDQEADLVRIGGLIGHNEGTVTSCSAIGNVAADGIACAGGLVGYTKTGTISGCHVTGSVTVTNALSNTYVGGLAGNMDSGTLTDCRSTSDVTLDGLASAKAYVGGLAGFKNSGVLQRSYSTGDVHISNISGGGNESFFGGLVGRTESGDMDSCFASGDIIASNVTVTNATQYFGGLAGYTRGGNMYRSYATGDFTGTNVSSSCYVGGLMGYDYYVFLYNCYAAGGMTETNGTNARLGGLMGSYYKANFTVEGYWNNSRNAIGIGDGKTALGTGLTQEQMTGTPAAISMSGLNFTYYEAKANDDDYSYYPQLSVFADSVDTGVQADSLESVSRSKACDITSWISPSAPVISGTNASKTVDNSTASLTVTVGVKAGAEWALYSNAGCTDEITDKVMSLAIGNNIAYLKVTSGDLTKIYTLNVFRSRFEGTGEAGSPYLIKTLEDLQAVEDSPSAHYKLNNDITDPLTEPIGDASHPFTGGFDGDGHSITINIASPGGYGGLFSYIAAGASVGNLTVTGSISNDAPGTVYMGALAGYSAGTVTNCTSGAIVSLTGGSTSDINYIGGLIGYNAGTVTDCTSAAVVSSTANGIDHIGGLAGYNTGSVTGCSASGNVASTGDARTGGLVGLTTGGTISDSYATGSVTAANVISNAFVGGLAGYMNSGTLINSHATGTVTVDGVASQPSYGGGLVGYMNSGTLQYDYSTGDVHVTNVTGSGKESDFGGLVGRMQAGTIDRCFASGDIIASTVTVTNAIQCFGGLAGYVRSGNTTYSYATGDFTGTSVSTACYVGGLVGYQYSGTLRSCYAAGVMTETDGTNAHPGGFLGSYRNSDFTCDNCYWNSSKNVKSVGDPGQTTPYGTGLTQAQMIGTAALTNMSGLGFPTYYVTKATDADYGYYPQLLVFANSTDAAVQADSLESVSQSAACDITSWTSPSGVSVIGTNATATVWGVTGSAVSVTVSDGAAWKLYSDSACSNEIINKTMSLSAGANTAYLLVTAENGVTTQRYTLTVTLRTYTIGPINDQTLAVLAEGYASGTQETRTITITKTGTEGLAGLAVSLSGTSASAFTITQPVLTTLDSTTPSTTFAVKAVDGLEAGTYTATVTVSAVSMTDVAFTVTQVVDTPPTVSDDNISISGATGSGGAVVFKLGDTVTATWDNTPSGDNNSDISSVTVDFSRFGGGSTVSAVNDSDVWTAMYTITPDSIEGVNLHILVTATDHNGYSTTTADTTNATVDNTAPVGGAVSINGGADYTTTAAVTLTLSATGADQMIISEDSGFVDASYESYAAGKSFTLSSGDGAKTVYVKYRDAAGNETVAVSDTIILDTQVPTATLSSTASDPTNASPIPVVITFSEAVTGFDVSDITIGNGTVAAGSFSGSGASYTVNIAPTTDGAVTVDVAAGAAQDLAGNSNTAAAQLSRSYDSQLPTDGTININSGALYTNSTAVTLTLSAAGATQMIISENSGFSGASYETYAASKSFTLSTDDGVKTVYVKYKDAAGNETVAVSDTITLDSQAPAVTLSSTAADPTNVSPIPVTITFSEDVTGFDESDITAGNGSVATGSFIGSGASYAVDITPSADGAVTVDVAAGKAQDAAGNDNTAAEQLSRTYDTQPPTDGTISINNGAVYTNSMAVTLTLSAAGAAQMILSEDSGFVGASYATYAVSKSFTLSTGDGVKTVYVKYKDAAGNETSVLSDTITLDTQAPADGTISINNSAVYTNSTAVTLMLSATGADQMIISEDNGFVGASYEAYAASRSFTLSPGDGVKTVYVKYKGATGNETAAISDTIILETQAPTVSLSSTAADPTKVSPIPVTITFSEDVTGFEESDIIVGNGTVAAGSFSGSGASYTVNITPTTYGSVTVDVTASAVQDIAGNNNTAAVQLSRTYAQLVSYTITATAGSGGILSITVNNRFYEIDDDTQVFTIYEVEYDTRAFTFTITPDFGYTIASVLIDGINDTAAVRSGSYTFRNVIASHTINAAFSPIGGSGDVDNDGGGGRTLSEPTYHADVKAGNGAATTLPVTVNKDTGSAAVDIGSGRLSSGGAGITIPPIPDVDTYSVGIPVPELSTSGVQGTLTINTDNGSITVSSNMLTGVVGISGSKAEISIGQGDKDNLPNDVKEAVGGRPLIQLSLSIDGKQTDWSNPDAPVTVSIPYTPTAEELVNPEGIVIWYIDGSGNAVCVPNGHYDPVTKTVIVEVTHFSDYAVVYNEVNFSDIPVGAWYGKAVSFIAARDITTGTGVGNFSPGAKLTRGQFLVMLMKAYELAPDTDLANNFFDAGNTYYTGYLAAARRLGISAGTGGNLFEPEKEITRQEMFTLLYNALKEIGQLPEGTVGRPLSAFADAGQTASWAKDALTLLTETGAVTGSDGKLAPLSTTTRAEMAQVLYNLLSK